MYDAVDRIWAVVGWQAERVRALLAPYSKVECVFNAVYRQGMFSSVQTGLARIDAPRAFLLPGDCAMVRPDTYTRMLSVQAGVVIPTFDGRKGHPVLFDHQAIREILALPDNAILRDYVQAKGFTALEVEDDGILLDLDTPEDYEAMRTRCHLRAGGFT